LTCTTFHKFDAIFLSLVKAHKHWCSGTSMTR
jgi:hypothetical protein